ncbi:hypothetical protein BDZ45DRAFT_733241 [Acephala macrosclerotiorum]|nr:hypothetical protein BDZ45DRAFT_733241 [Acephala macrosclerotiorum]
MVNSTESIFGSSIFNFGNGLIEITTLTSLIGSTAAQSLAIGDKGPAGLVWATMTIFGAMSIAMLFTAAVTPGWLRDSVGVRSAKSDAVVGLSLDLSKSFKYRSCNGAPKAVECEIQIGTRGKKVKGLIELECREVYAFEQRTASILNVIPESRPGEELKVYSFIQDPWHETTTSSYFKLDCVLLAFSTVAKLAEFLVLRKYGAFLLAWITISSWLFFFSAALTLRLHDLRKYSPKSEIDIITGSLLTCSTAGGSRKVLLGIPKSARRHILWRAIWGFGGAVGVTTVFATYIALGHSTSTDVFFIWVGFQALWLLSRSTLFYCLSDRENQYAVGLEGKSWLNVGPQERARVRRLVFALSKYQQRIHPRSFSNYIEDMDSIESLPNVRSEYPLSSHSEEVVPISVYGVVGDTLLTSISWIFGFKRGGFDFYDTCIIILNTSSGLIAIPAARALYCKPPAEAVDFELGFQPSHLPRGGVIPSGSWGNLNDNGPEWCYWIPCPGKRWLFFTTEKVKVKGARNASVLSDTQMTEKLKRGTIAISLVHVDEIKEIVATSTLACEHLIELLK